MLGDLWRMCARALLLAVMLVLSVMLWAGSPLAWLWLGSRLADGSGAQLGPYAVVITGILVTSLVLAKALLWLDDLYAQLSGQTASRFHAAWMRSVSADRDERPPRRALDYVMLASVALAFGAFAYWFFTMAGSPLPSP
jgi:hypothetical protein